MDSFGVRARLHWHQEPFVNNNRSFYRERSDFAPYYKTYRGCILRDTRVHKLVLIPPKDHKQSGALKGIGPDVVYSRRNDKTFRTWGSTYATQKARKCSNESPDKQCNKHHYYLKKWSPIDSFMKQCSTEAQNLINQESLYYLELRPLNQVKWRRRINNTKLIFKKWC